VESKARALEALVAEARASATEAKAADPVPYSVRDPVPYADLPALRSASLNAPVSFPFQ